MLLSRASLHLLAPAATEGGGGATTADPMLESDPSAMSGWMKDLPSLDVPLTQKKDPNDGKTNDNAGGASGTGLSTGAAAANNATGSNNAAAAPGVQPAAAAAPKPEDAAAAKPADDKAKEVAPVAEKAGEKPVEDKWPRSSADWEKYKRVHAEKEGKLQKEIETRQEKITTLETQVAEFQKKPTETSQVPPEIQAQLDTVTKERDELSQRIQVLDVTHHPKFQQFFESKVNAQKNLAKSVLGDEKIGAFEEIIKLPPGKFKMDQLEDFVRELPQLQQIRIGAVINTLDTIEEERKEEIAKASTHKDQLGAQDKAKRESAVKNREKTIGDYVAHIQNGGKEGNPIYQQRKGDEAWNAGVNDRIATAKRILTGEGLKAPDIIKAAFDAAALPATLRMWEADMTEKDGEITKLKGELDSLKTQVSRLTAAQPKVEGGGAEGSGEGRTTSSRPEIGQNPAQAMDSFTSGLWKAQE